MKPSQRSCWTNERGATLVVVGLLLTALVGFSALAIDIGYLYAARNELQNIADASALAAARKIGMTYQGMTPAEQSNYVCDKTEIVALVNEVAQKNKAAGSTITIAAADVLIGRWGQWQPAPQTPKTENLSQPNAVHVIARRDSLASGNGPITTFFARVIGIDTADVSAKATAALTGLGQALPGEIKLPVGISEVWFQKGEPYAFCGQEIKFYPTDSCAGWNGFEDNPNKKKRLENILTEQIPSSEVNVNDTTFYFSGGAIATYYNELFDLFQKYAQWVDENGNPTTEGNGTFVWTTTVAVYKNESDTIEKCFNPVQDLLITGFATVEITEVQTAPEKTMKGRVICNKVEQDNTRGGGGSFGLLSPISGLVE